MAIVMDLYSSFEGKSEWESDRQRRTVRREEIVLVAMREKRYVSEPIQSIQIVDCWFYLGSCGI